MSRLKVTHPGGALVRSIVVASIVSAMVTVLAMRVLEPRQSHAQAAQQGEVRATSFTLVGADGTVLATLKPGPSRNGQLVLTDTAGKPRAFMNGAGQVGVLDPSGRGCPNLAAGGACVRAALQYNPDMGFANIGVSGAKGFTNIVYNDQLDVTGAFVFDQFSHPQPTGRIGLGVRADGSYGLAVRDSDGNIIAATPDCDQPNCLAAP